MIGLLGTGTCLNYDSLFDIDIGPSIYHLQNLNQYPTCIFRRTNPIEYFCIFCKFCSSTTLDREKVSCAGRRAYLFCSVWSISFSLEEPKLLDVGSIFVNACYKHIRQLGLIPNYKDYAAQLERGLDHLGVYYLLTQPSIRWWRGANRNIARKTTSIDRRSWPRL